MADVDKHSRNVLYHMGHYGYLSKFLIHELTYHKDDNIVLIWENTFSSLETNNFMSTWNIKNSKLGKLYIYHDSIFWHESDMDSLELEIIKEFDNLFKKINIDIENFDYIYSGCDGLNAFTAYLGMKGIKYTVFDLNGTSLKKDSLYDASKVKYGKNSETYLDVLKKYRALSADSEYCGCVIWDSPNYIDGKENKVIDYVESLHSLSDVDKKILVSAFYDQDMQLSGEYTLIPLRSYASIKYSKIKFDEIPPIQNFIYPYRLLIDYSCDELDKLLIKAHPNYEIPSKILEINFPGSIYIPGYFPFEFLGILDNLRINKIVSIGTTATRYYQKIPDSLIISEQYFNVYVLWNVIFASLSLFNYICGNMDNIECKIRQKNKELSQMIDIVINNHLIGNEQTNNLSMHIMDSCSNTYGEIIDDFIQSSNCIIAVFNPTIELIRDTFQNNAIIKLSKKEICSSMPKTIVDLDDEYLLILFKDKTILEKIKSYNVNKKLEHCGVELTCEWCEKDLKEALNVASDFSVEGDPSATGRLARMYRDGKGVERDLDKAIALMRQAANKNIGWAKNELIDLLLKRNREEDLKEALNVGQMGDSINQVNLMNNLYGRLRSKPDWKSLNHVIDRISKYIKNRRLVIWNAGADIENDLWKCATYRPDVQEILRDPLHISNDPLMIDNVHIFDVTQIVNNVSNFYVLVLNNIDPSTIEKTLNKSGYKDVFDYLFLMPVFKYVKNATRYSDLHGNVIRNLPNNLTVILKGYDNVVDFGKNIKFGADSELHLRNRSYVFIGDNSSFGKNSKIICDNYSYVSSKQNCVYGSALIGCGKHGKLEVGSNSVFGDRIELVANDGHQLFVGNSVLASRNCSIRAGDGHRLFDVQSRRPTNYMIEQVEKCQTIIGNDVWIGYGATILLSQIGSGCVVGASSLIKGAFPNNCLMAGVPAKILKKNVAWSRNPLSTDIMDCGNSYAIPTIDLSRLRASLRELRQIADLKEYLNQLAKSNRILIITCLRGVVSNDITLDLEQNLKNLGFNPCHLEHNGQIMYDYCGVMINNELVFEDIYDNFSSDFVHCICNGSICLKSGLTPDNHKTILINDYNYLVNEDGINIITYDLISNQLIDSVCFNVKNTLAMTCNRKISVFENATKNLNRTFAKKLRLSKRFGLHNILK